MSTLNSQPILVRGVEYEQIITFDAQTTSTKIASTPELEPNVSVDAIQRRILSVVQQTHHWPSMPIANSNNFNELMFGKG